MKFRTGLFIAAGACVLAGALIGGIAAANGGWIADKGTRHEEKITSDILKLNVLVSMGDITVVCGDKDYIKVVYYETEKKKCDIIKDNNTLTIKSNNERMKWYDYIGNFHGNDVLLEIPKGFLGDIKLESKMGDVDVSGAEGNINITSSYGDIAVSSCSTPNFTCLNKCGDVDIENVSGSIEVNSKKGDIEFKNISGNISLKNDLGDIEGTILGREDEYTINADTKLGDSNIRSKAGGSKKLDIQNDCGDIEVKFVG